MVQTQQYGVLTMLDFLPISTIVLSVVTLGIIIGMLGELGNPTPSQGSLMGDRMYHLLAWVWVVAALSTLGGALEWMMQ